MKILDYIKDFKSLKLALYITSASIMVVGTAAWRVGHWVVDREREAMKQEILDNTKEVDLNHTLKGFANGMDSLRSCLLTLKGDFESYRTEKDESFIALAKTINRVDENLIFYVEYRDSISTQQMLRVFEMGREEQKKTTLSKPLSNIDGGKNTSITENQTPSLYP